MFSLGKASVRLMKVTQSLTSWPRHVHPRPSSIKRFCQTSRFPAYHGNHWRTMFCNVFVFAWLLSSLVSQLSFPADVLSHRRRFFFVIRSVVDMLWKNAAHHLQRQAFPPSGNPLLALHPPTPSFVATPRRAHSVCRQDTLDGGFLGAFFLLWAEVFFDLWFGFQRLQMNEPPFSPEAWQPCWDMMRATKCREGPPPPPPPLPHKTPDTLFISGNLTLLFSSPIPPFSLPPHPHSILNNIYI